LERANDSNAADLEALVAKAQSSDVEAVIGLGWLVDKNKAIILFMI
jgi:hypothetical protein